uniref:Uncharacterized protein n=1 Tax=Leishmania guyanensis TaxID=5670 RepID=A0A1E1J0G3_LEIGU|nr:Hypothetical protein BN36_2845640 [Leishmania guyanensis]
MWREGYALVLTYMRVCIRVCFSVALFVCVCVRPCTVDVFLFSRLLCLFIYKRVLRLSFPPTSTSIHSFSSFCSPRSMPPLSPNTSLLYFSLPCVCVVVVAACCSFPLFPLFQHEAFGGVSVTCYVLAS